MPHHPTPLGRRTSFWVCAAVVAHTFWTSAAPAMTYPLYAAEWGLTSTMTTAIFAVYPIVVVTVLILFGGLSDLIGRRETLLLGLGASIAGVLLFAVAPSLAWLFIARALMGIGVGLSAGPSAAAMVEFNVAGSPSRASSVTTAAQAAGFTLALLLGGALIQYAPYPTRLSFWVLFVVLGVLFMATWFLPRRTEPRTAWRSVVSAPVVPEQIRSVFLVSAIAVSTAYTHGVLILSLGSQVARELIGSDNAFVSAATLSLFAISIGVFGMAGRRFSARNAMLLGAFASAASMGLLSNAVSSHLLLTFVAATAAAGAGYSLLFRGGLERVSAAAPSEGRGGVLSALFLSAYLSVGVVALVLGVVATHRGLKLAVDLGAGVIALMSVLSAGLALWSRPVGLQPQIRSPM